MLGKKETNGTKKINFFTLFGLVMQVLLQDMMTNVLNEINSIEFQFCFYLLLPAQSRFTLSLEMKPDLRRVYSSIQANHYFSVSPLFCFFGGMDTKHPCAWHLFSHLPYMHCPALPWTLFCWEWGNPQCFHLPPGF